MSSLPNPKNPSDPFRLSSQHPNSPPDHLLFAPAPEIASAILDDLADPFKSFSSIAQSRGTTLEGLTLWMQRPDIARRLDALESAFNRRGRLQASGYLPLCIDALARAISGFSRDDAQAAPLPNSPKLDEQRRKSRETLLRMTRVMMQLSKFQQSAAKPATLAPPRPAVRPVNPVDPRTSTSPAPSRAAESSAPRSADHSAQRAGDTQLRSASVDRPQMNSGASRAPQSDQRVLSTV